MTDKCWWPGVGRVEQLAPGVYTDADGNVHFAVAEILQALGVEDTNGNRAMVSRRLLEEGQQVIAEIPPGTAVEVG